jgi:hypothetical protein
MTEIQLVSKVYARYSGSAVSISIDNNRLLNLKMLLPCGFKVDVFKGHYRDGVKLIEDERGPGMWCEQVADQTDYSARESRHRNLRKFPSTASLFLNYTSTAF